VLLLSVGGVDGGGVGGSEQGALLVSLFSSGKGSFFPLRVPDFPAIELKAFFWLLLSLWRGLLACFFFFFFFRWTWWRFTGWPVRSAHFLMIGSFALLHFVVYIIFGWGMGLVEWVGIEGGFGDEVVR
jgi:hypothetical protein